VLADWNPVCARLEAGQLQAAAYTLEQETAAAGGGAASSLKAGGGLGGVGGSGSCDAGHIKVRADQVILNPKPYTSSSSYDAGHIKVGADQVSTAGQS
jgi:hypothetical protein